MKCLCCRTIWKCSWINLHWAYSLQHSSQNTSALWTHHTAGSENEEGINTQRKRISLKKQSSGVSRLVWAGWEGWAGTVWINDSQKLQNKTYRAGTVNKTIHLRKYCVIVRNFTLTKANWSSNIKKKKFILVAFWVLGFFFSV